MFSNLLLEKKPFFAKQALNKISKTSFIKENCVFNLEI